MFLKRKCLLIETKYEELRKKGLLCNKEYNEVL
jgi:hypothetical protein